jgi:hypothetical protein
MNLFISIGHSGGRVGATAYGTTEFQECEKIGRAMEKLLRPILGQSLYMVPIEFDIIERCAYINAQSTANDIVVELHMDSGTDRSTGCGIFYKTKNEEKEARQLISAYRNLSDIPVRFCSIHTDSRHGRLGIIEMTKPTTYLVELGFITNRDQLDVMRKKSAQSLTDAIRTLFFPTHVVHVSEWAKKSAEKAQKKGAITSWANPREVMTDELWQHVFHNMGVLDTVNKDEPLTRERVAVILDRLGLLS